MKRLAIIAIMMGLAGTAMGQDTVSEPDGRLPEWHISFWYDTCIQYYEYFNIPDKPLDNWSWVGGFKLAAHYDNGGSLTCKPEYVSHPTALKGVGVWIIDNNESEFPLRPVMGSEYAPEYIYVFQQGVNDTMIMLDSVRWDTAQYRILKQPFNADSALYGFKYIRLYTVYFDNPVEVDSVYTLAGTTNSNHIDGNVWRHTPVRYSYLYKSHSWPLGEGSCNIPLCWWSRASDGIWYCRPERRWGCRYEYYGLFMPITDEDAWLEVHSADPDMGAAGPVGTRTVNTTQTIWARPKRGYRFSHWDDGDTHCIRSIRFVGDTSFTAYFDINERHTLTATSNTRFGRVDGGGEYYHGDTAVLTPVPLLANYQFTSWSDGDSSNPRLVVVTCDTAFEAQFEYNAVGIKQPKVDDGTLLFVLTPNPTREWVTVTLAQAAKRPCVVTLRDEQGRELLRQQMEGQTLTLTTQGLEAGLYFVTLESAQGTSTQKLVVE